MAGPPRFRILGELGRGGMGVVYRARHDVLGRDVAVKVVLGNDPELLLRFRREAEACARLSHPNLVAVHEAGATPQGQPFLVMDLVEGRSLHAVLKAGPLAPELAARVVRDAARGVQHAHERGVLHRDLKPHNIIVPPGDGPARVLDFGLAALQDQRERLTRTGAVLGTPAYMAPEQLGERSGVDARTDVYGLGAVLYEALVGEPPFKGASGEVLLQVLSRSPASPRARRPEVPAALDAITLRAMAKEREDRPASAGALADDLQRFLDGEAVESRVPSRLERAWRVVRRRPARAAAALGAAALLGLALPAGLVLTSAGLASSRVLGLAATVDGARPALEAGEPLAAEQALLEHARAATPGLLDRKARPDALAELERARARHHLARARLLAGAACAAPPDRRAELARRALAALADAAALQDEALPPAARAARAWAGAAPPRAARAVDALALAGPGGVDPGLEAEQAAAAWLAAGRAGPPPLPAPDDERPRAVLARARLLAAGGDRVELARLLARREAAARDAVPDPGARAAAAGRDAVALWLEVAAIACDSATGGLDASSAGRVAPGAGVDPHPGPSPQTAGDSATGGDLTTGGASPPAGDGGAQAAAAALFVDGRAAVAPRAAARLALALDRPQRARRLLAGDAAATPGRAVALARVTAAWPLTFGADLREAPAAVDEAAALEALVAALRGPVAPGEGEGLLAWAEAGALALALREDAVSAATLPADVEALARDAAGLLGEGAPSLVDPRHARARAARLRAIARWSVRGRAGWRDVLWTPGAPDPEQRAAEVLGARAVYGAPEADARVDDGLRALEEAARRLERRAARALGEAEPGPTPSLLPAAGPPEVDDPPAVRRAWALARPLRTTFNMSLLLVDPVRRLERVGASTEADARALVGRLVAAATGDGSRDLVGTTTEASGLYVGPARDEARRAEVMEALQAALAAERMGEVQVQPCEQLTRGGQPLLPLPPGEDGAVLVLPVLRLREQPLGGHPVVRYARLADLLEGLLEGAGPGARETARGGTLASMVAQYRGFAARAPGTGEAMLRLSARCLEDPINLRTVSHLLAADRLAFHGDLQPDCPSGDLVDALRGDDPETLVARALLRGLRHALEVARPVLESAGGLAGTDDPDRAGRLRRTRDDLPAAFADLDRALALEPGRVGARALRGALRVVFASGRDHKRAGDDGLDLALEDLDLACASASQHEVMTLDLLRCAIRRELDDPVGARRGVVSTWALLATNESHLLDSPAWRSVWVALAPGLAPLLEADPPPRRAR